MQKRIALINSVYNQGSTGRICFELTQFLQSNCYKVKTFYGRNKNSSAGGVYFGSKLDNYIHGLKSRITDKHAFYSKAKTRVLIKKLEEFKPDLLILHNLHGYYLNIEILLKWIKEKNIKVISVFHDCWNFTGHCTYFSLKNCTRWQLGCHDCPCKNDYPKTILIDNSKRNFEAKKKLYSDIKDLIVVTPSNWLANLAKETFFSNHEIVVINNGIDVNLFKKNVGGFRKQYHLESKKIILCIANMFDERKGLYDVIKLSKLLSPDEVIVMVGQIKTKIKLPNNILHINRTDSIKLLVDIYSSSNVMFNPTYEDNYPTTNLEALSCCCPVVCYKTGGATEMLDNRFVIEQGDIDGAYQLIKNMFNNKNKYNFDKMDFSKSKMHKSYLKLIDRFMSE